MEERLELRMKVKVVFTIDVDQQAYADEYCLDPSEVRDDVKVAAENLVTEHFNTLGLLSQKN
jgi:hypothetical protein